jgi:formylglycine-generating enzyme required for sulfatase activity
MRNCTYLICTVFLISIIACASIQVADAQSEEKESTTEKSSDKDGAITDSIGMKLKLIEPGKFMMGSKKGESNERPVHWVKISNPFYIGVHEVTQAQYEEVMGKNPSHVKGPSIPVDSVTWAEAMSFCKKLSEKEGVRYRLPTEAEWEYACRAETETEYYWGDEIDGEYAWHYDNSEDKPHDVGTRKPNDWGLYDMSGNVWEWCYDWYAPKYPGDRVKDPRGPKEGKSRVVRGGSWYNSAKYCRSATRSRYNPNRTSDYTGFRVVRHVK